MEAKVLSIIAISEAVSCFLGYRMLKRKESALEKMGLFVVLLIPVFGPIFYLFLVENVPPNNPLLMNKRPRGSYTHHMIGIQADVEAADQQKSKKEPDSSRPVRKRRRLG